MAKVTPEEFADKWVRRTSGAVTDMRSGVEKVTESPCAKAAKKGDKMIAGITAAVQSGKWAKKLAAVSTEDWKKAMLEKGIGRVAQGVESARGKSAAFAAKLLPAVDAAAAKVKAMPDLTIEDSVNRVATFIREMSKFSSA